MSEQMQKLLDDIEIERIAQMPDHELHARADKIESSVFQLTVLRAMIQALPVRIEKLNGGNIDFSNSPGDEIMIDLQGMINSSVGFLDRIIEDLKNLNGGNNEK